MSPIIYLSSCSQTKSQGHRISNSESKNSELQASNARYKEEGCKHGDLESVVSPKLDDPFQSYQVNYLHTSPKTRFSSFEDETVIFI